MRHGTTQTAKETWPQIQFSDLQWQEVLIPHSNPRASLQPTPRPRRIGESPGNMTTYELESWKSSHPVCPTVLQCVKAAVRLDWSIPFNPFKKVLIKFYIAHVVNYEFSTSFLPLIPPSSLDWYIYWKSHTIRPLHHQYNHFSSEIAIF